MWKAIINFINSKTYRCEHNWQEIHVAEVYSEFYASSPIYFKYIYRCTKCCKSKTIKT